MSRGPNKGHFFMNIVRLELSALENLETELSLGGFQEKLGFCFPASREIDKWVVSVHVSKKKEDLCRKGIYRSSKCIWLLNHRCSLVSPGRFVPQTTKVSDVTKVSDQKQFTTKCSFVQRQLPNSSPLWKSKIQKILWQLLRCVILLRWVMKWLS